MQETIAPDCGVEASLKAFTSVHHSIKFENTYHVECHDADGNLKWVEDVHNLVTTEGVNDLLNRYFKGTGSTPPWYVGIYGGTGTLAIGDTAATHAGWTEVTAYSEAARPTLTLGTVASGSVNNSGSAAVFTANGSATVLGAFVISNNTKGGTTGVLFGEAAFSASRTLVATDTLTVTVTLTATAG